MLSMVFWIIVAIAVTLLDILTSSFLFVWFAVGAFAAMIADLLGATVGIQIIIFLVVSIITISIGYPWARKKFKTSVKHTPLMEETYIGRIMKAEADIEKKARVKIDGIYWAIQNNGDTIKKGTNFKIVGIEGNKIIVNKEEEK
ncbi:NfeD family protein [Clostridium chauvoei]|uniref:NfeD family protein n=2 Tax=Clostridium chauvoei TaxID=46867 RepID=A0ABD4RIY6_9CLOT|nr:NfeD family protein [Clostridium chauvoei]ATD54772.1 nodulation efficiency protein D [Clostridium chauvoei]ATD57548.1 nodulation efficiency protein D [Clostridium chauvoei]MBX7281268.1 NfeD family protein [Clostridium chauvoei]MBX7283750.1 NfeD family protein [Clostridium chauvoei]MBX7286350.1 NfeD family protein [Clostridium chauvoei]